MGRRLQLRRGLGREHSHDPTSGAQLSDGGAAGAAVGCGGTRSGHRTCAARGDARRPLCARDRDAAGTGRAVPPARAAGAMRERRRATPDRAGSDHAALRIRMRAGAAHGERRAASALAAPGRDADGVLDGRLERAAVLRAHERCHRGAAGRATGRVRLDRRCRQTLLRPGHPAHPARRRSPAVRWACC